MIDSFRGLHLGKRARPLYLLVERLDRRHPLNAGKIDAGDWVVIGGPWPGGKLLRARVDELIAARPYRRHCAYRLLRTQEMRAMMGGYLGGDREEPARADERAGGR